MSTVKADWFRANDPRIDELDRLLDGLGDRINFRQIGAGDLHSNGALDTRSQHIDTVADGRDPDIGQPRYLDPCIQFSHKFLSFLVINK